MIKPTLGISTVEEFEADIIFKKSVSIPKEGPGKL